jgi:hypothetical protein
MTRSGIEADVVYDGCVDVAVELVIRPVGSRHSQEVARTRRKGRERAGEPELLQEGMGSVVPSRPEQEPVLAHLRPEDRAQNLR